MGDMADHHTDMATRSDEFVEWMDEKLASEYPEWPGKVLARVTGLDLIRRPRYVFHIRRSEER